MQFLIALVVKGRLYGIGLLLGVFLVGIPNLQAQTHEGSASTITLNLASAIASLSYTVEQQQKALERTEQRLIDLGITDSQLEAWEQQHSAAFQALEAKSDLLTAYEAYQPMQVVATVEIPEDASEAKEDFLMARAELHNDLAQIHNQLAQTTVDSISVESAADLEETEREVFTQQDADEIKDQVNRAEVVGDEAAHQAWALPLPSPIPEGASPDLVAFLAVRDQISRGQALVHNRYCAGDLDVLETAIQQWQDRHADLFQRYRQLAQALAQANPTEE